MKICLILYGCQCVSPSLSLSPILFLMCRCLWVKWPKSHITHGYIEWPEKAEVIVTTFIVCLNGIYVQWLPKRKKINNLTACVFFQRKKKKINVQKKSLHTKTSNNDNQEKQFNTMILVIMMLMLSMLNMTIIIIEIIGFFLFFRYCCRMVGISEKLLFKIWFLKKNTDQLKSNDKRQMWLRYEFTTNKNILW